MPPINYIIYSGKSPWDCGRMTANDDNDTIISSLLSSLPSAAAAASGTSDISSSSSPHPMENILHLDIISDPDWILVYKWHRRRNESRITTTTRGMASIGGINGGDKKGSRRHRSHQNHIEEPEEETTTTTTPQTRKRKSPLAVNSNYSTSTSNSPPPTTTTYQRKYLEAIPISQEPLTNGFLSDNDQHHHSLLQYHSPFSWMIHRYTGLLKRKHREQQQQQKHHNKDMHALESCFTIMLHIPSIEKITSYEFMKCFLLQHCLIKNSPGATKGTTSTRGPSHCKLLLEPCYNAKRIRRGLDWEDMGVLEAYCGDDDDDGNDKKKKNQKKGVSNSMKRAFKKYFSWQWIEESSSQQQKQQLVMESKYQRTLASHHFLRRNLHEYRRHLYLQRLGVETVAHQQVSSQPAPTTISHFIQHHTSLYRISLSQLRILLFPSDSGRHHDSIQQQQHLRHLFHLLNGCFVALGYDSRHFENASEKLPLFLPEYPDETFQFHAFAVIAHVDMIHNHLYIRVSPREFDAGCKVNTILLSRTTLPSADVSRDGGGSTVASSSSSANSTSSMEMNTEALSGSKSKGTPSSPPAPPQPVVQNIHSSLPYYSTCIPQEPHLSSSLDAQKFREIGSYGMGNKTRRKKVIQKRQKSMIQRLNTSNWG